MGLIEAKAVNQTGNRNMYQEALMVQSASNISGVLHAFERHVATLRALADLNGISQTEMLEKHAVMRLFIEQLHHLSSRFSYHSAYNECCKMSGWDDEEIEQMAGR